VDQARAVLLVGVVAVMACVSGIAITNLLF